MSHLSKKQRKQLRQQMHERKQELIAKHGRPQHHGTHGNTSKPTVNDRGSAGSMSAGGVATLDRLGSNRPFAHIQPKLPADPPKPAVSAPRWEPPTPAERALPPKVLAKPTPTPVVESTQPPVITMAASESPTSEALHTTLPSVRDLDQVGPGPLTRTAASVERSVRQAIQLYQARPWQRPTVKRRADAHRSLALLVKPLRWLGVAAVVGAFALGRESRGAGFGEMGSLVVLGMGLGLAVVLLALAEMSAALRVMMTRR